MKYYLLSVCLFSSSAFCEESVNPFLETEADKKNVNFSRLDSDAILPDSLLDKFREPRLDNGSEVDVIRITILRSLHDPLMFTWTVDSKYPEKLSIKKVERIFDKNGELKYGELVLNKNIDLTESQSGYFKKILAVSDAHNLDPEDWQPETLDGSTWIYEFVSRENSIILVRKNPIDARLGNLPIPQEKLLKELTLTSMALMIWSVANLENEDLY